MKTVKGDLIKMALDGDFDVIVHGCNCFNTMGSGIAKQVKEVFPKAYEIDQNTVKGSITKLGTYTYAIIGKYEDLIVINAYTQHKYNGKKVLVNYNAVRSIFNQIKHSFAGKRIGYPKIGAGLAGGDWTEISVIIDECLEGEDHTLVEWDR